VRAASHLLASAALAAALASAGCYKGTAHAISPHQVAADSDWLAVPNVPLLRQEGRSDCGAAVLAMVLSFWSLPTTVADINAKDPVAAQQGWKAGQLRDIARATGLQAFLIRGGLKDLSNELQRGRPVIVGLVQRYGDRGRGHYEVVIGIDAKKKRILSLDPSAGWREDSWEGFAREWVTAEQVTLVVLPGAANPPQSPARPAPSAQLPPRSPGAS
jgi:ABC-type bacteriocin/lantibiotic exporter with double-glycine peptidase domain